MTASRSGLTVQDRWAGWSSRPISARHGGTFTITNPGPFGTLVSAHHQPAAGGHSFHRWHQEAPVVLEVPGAGEVITIHLVGNLSLSFDHRAFDGAYAAGFISRVKQLLEADDWSPRL
jgi:pyruvate dehydrogenase E2 component (dihydrolipoamide acetyltransferase)